MNIFEILLIQPLANALILFYRISGGNLGLAIVLLSVALKIILIPSTNKSLENIKKLNELKPHLEKLKEKHKGDKQKLMQAQSDFYKTHGFNPSAGCLPQILQIVVLYALFSVFQTVLAQNINIVEKFNTLLYEPLKFATSDTVNTRFLYLDISKPDTVNIPGLPFALPGPLLLLAAISQMISAKIAAPFIKKEEQIAKKTKTEVDDGAVAMQSSTLVMLPLLTLVFGMNFPAGLAIYWVVFSVIQTYQQYRIGGLGGLTPVVSKIKSVLH